LGYRNEEEVLTLDIKRDLFFDQDQRAVFQRAIEEQGFVKDFELLIKRADGTKLTVLETASVVRDNGGKIVMYRGIFRDVTQQRQLEQDLIQVHKMESLGTLAAGIAHDFNNILSIILVYNSLIQRIANDPNKLAQSTGAIHEAVQRGANLVKQILTFARKTEVHVGPIDIDLAMKDVAKMLRETFPKTINLDLQLANEVPFITADATQIQQVLLNLCVNARDAMPAGGTLTLKSEMASGRSVHTMFSEARASEYVHISVKDTGVGMDEATRGHIFDPFFTTKDKGKGTGLGLSVVYGAVKNHGGFVQVDSELNRGSVFHLYFPIPTKTLAPFNLKQGEEKEIPGGSETLLIVEDEDAIRSNIESLFVAKGYRVITARDGGEAVEVYKDKKDNIHLVLSDLGLPTFSGDQVLFLLKAINPDVKVLFASGYFEPDTKNELSRAGAVDFVQKPYTPEEILRKVRKALDRA
jgi:two-component system, cell cycle sensor histidine kinase and response regulator CckA